MELIEHPEVLAAEIKGLLDNPIVLEQVSHSGGCRGQKS